MLKINKILSKKIKFPLSLRGLFPFCHSRESGNPSFLSFRGAKRRSNLSGFSLIELMIAVTILALAVFGIFHAYSVGFLGMADARDRTVATNYAREAMEDVKNMDFEKIATTTKSVITSNRKYRVDVNVTTESDNLKKVSTVVSWKDRNGVGKTVETSMLVHFIEVFASDAAKIVLFTESYNILNSFVAPEYEKYTSTELTAVIKDLKGNTITDWGEDPNENEGPISFSIISLDKFGTLSDNEVTPIDGRAYTTFTSNGSMSGNFGINIIEASVYLPDAGKTVTDTITIKITNGPVKISLDADPKIIKASATNYSTITASLIDAAGKTLMKKDIFTDIEITFSVFGEGNLSTSTITIPFHSGDTSAASAEIILNSTGNPGLASVVATATDLESSKIDVRFLGPPVAISISANPNPMYFDVAYSTITVCLLDINGFNTNPTDELITISLELTTDDTGGHLEAPYSWDFPTSDSEGIIRETTFTGQSFTGTATITASGGGLTAASVTINVVLALVPDHIKLSASPQNVKAGGLELSTIKATVYDISGKIVTNYTGTINFVKTSGTFYGDNPPPVVNGVATIEIGSTNPGNVTVNIVNPDPGNLTIEPSDGIDIGFYSDPDSIELTANPTEVYGTETSIIKAIIYDGFGNIVVGELITFNTTFGTFSNESNTIEITPLDGIAITELSSNVIGNPITATINAFSSTLSAIPIDVILHEKVDLFLVIGEPISYEPVDKTVAFTIKVTGKDITVDEMKVSWSDNTPSEKLYKITVDNNEEIFNGNKKSGDNADINPNKDLSIGEYTIKLTFIQDMAGRHIEVIFYPPVSGQYLIEFDVPVAP